MRILKRTPYGYDVVLDGLLGVIKQFKSAESTTNGMYDIVWHITAFRPGEHDKDIYFAWNGERYEEAKTVTFPHSN
jgi:hypothetical protein